MSQGQPGVHDSAAFPHRMAFETRSPKSHASGLCASYAFGVPNLVLGVERMKDTLKPGTTIDVRGAAAKGR